MKIMINLKTRFSLRSAALQARRELSTADLHPKTADALAVHVNLGLAIANALC